MLPDKPLYTQPCNHCGLCCSSSLCHVGEKLFEAWQLPCPALLSKDDKAICSVVDLEMKSGVIPIISNSLGIGCGCSMPDEDTTDEEIDSFDMKSREMIFNGK